MRQSKFHRDIPNTMKISGRFRIKGGTKQQREIAEKVIRWCFENNVVVRQGIDIDVKICKYVTHQCWGSVVDSGGEITSMTMFDMTIANNQSIRDFVATIVHEMVHINQYITGEWEGDGEKEAEDNQYVIADKVWQEGIV